MIFGDKCDPDKELLLPSNKDLTLYQPVIPCRDKRFLGCLSLDSYFWAVYKICSEIIALFSFGMAAYMNVNTAGNLSLLGSYAFFSLVAAPLWQHFSIQPVNSVEAGRKEVGCDHGCMLCMACVHMSGICLCKNLIVIRGDKRVGGSSIETTRGGWKTQPVDSERLDRNSYSRTFSTDSHTGEPVISRYIPFSFYNLVYIINHDGQKELNPELPFDDMLYFGMGRSVLLCYGTAIRASLNITLFYNAYYSVHLGDNDLYMYASLVALLSALMELDIYFIAVFFGTILYPYAIVVWIAIIFPMFDWLLNPEQGSFLFWMLKKYWKAVVSRLNKNVKDDVVEELGYEHDNDYVK